MPHFINIFYAKKKKEEMWNLGYCAFFITAFFSLIPSFPLYLAKIIILTIIDAEKAVKEKRFVRDENESSLLAAMCRLLRTFSEACFRDSVY